MPAIWRLTGTDRWEPLHAITGDEEEFRGSWYGLASDGEPEILIAGEAVDGATDAAIIHGPMIVVSERVRDVFLRFDLGASEFLELPLYDADQSTPLDLPPRYVMDVQETKEGFLPEQTQLPMMIRNPATGERIAGSRWVLAEGHDTPVVVSVADSCVEGVDVWGFANLAEVFVSDRLKQALDDLPAASGLLFEPCRVVSSDGVALPQPSPWPKRIKAQPSKLGRASAWVRQWVRGSDAPDVNEVDEAGHPIIWRCPITVHSSEMPPFDAFNRDGSRFSNSIRYKAFQAMPPDEEPAYLAPDKSSERFNPRDTDSIIIVGDVIVVSERMRDLLVQFDLGATRLFELPVLEMDHRTPVDTPPYFMLHVCETKTGFLPDQSIGVERRGHPITGVPAPNAPWTLRRAKGDELCGGGLCRDGR